MIRLYNDVVFAIVAATSLLLLLSVFIVAFVLIYQRKKHKHLRAMLQLKNEQELMQKHYEEEILRTQLEIQEQTLNTISGEIHDNIGQMLSLVKLNLALVDVEGNHPHQQKISDSHQLVKKVIQDLRHLSHSMNAGYVSDMGLQRALEYELEMIRKTGVMDTIFETEGAVRRLDKQKELIFFRIAQECFNNVIKHAEANKLLVKISYLPEEIFLWIKDNGKGIDLILLNENAEAGLGIRNMKNRATLISADFSIASVPGQGTEITIHLKD